MGIIALNCLNLPPRLRFKQAYTCLSGIIPAPNQPDMFTTKNILRPLFDDLLVLSQGIKISTPEYPHGCKVTIHLIGLIGDVVDTYKVSGFISHSTKQFCSWCEINNNERCNLNLGTLCNKNKVLALSWKCKETPSTTARQ
ncbi:hypothetical protein O181_016988 [Austropuccinia psidii MF-1]|uniref:Uncharacterized protein n=1 Tax=Austropuccinia psidii MF-1 TaxID=1389203 RepID=A0A9Q3C5E3_9BASI|nr:hypothetical protein [Austropuccinia psidii MF-1]